MPAREPCSLHCTSAWWWRAAASTRAAGTRSPRRGRGSSPSRARRTAGGRWCRTCRRRAARAPWRWIPGPTSSISRPRSSARGPTPPRRSRARAPPSLPGPRLPRAAAAPAPPDPSRDLQGPRRGAGESVKEEVLIAGAGPIGLACAISARRRGLNPLVIDAGAIAHAIVRYPVGMVFFTTPERLEIGGHPLVCAGPKATREEALKYYRGIVRAEGLRVRTFTRLTGARRANGGVECRLAGRRGEERVGCDRLVFATGYFDHPNRLGVPGEELAHVSHYGEEPHVTAGREVVIVGAKNSAVEQALGCYRAGARVTLVARGPALKPSVKYWLKPDLENRIKAGEIAARWSTTVERIEPDAVVVRGPGGESARLPADRVY